MLFNLIFLSLLFTGWLICAFIPWLIVSVATRGSAGLANLPLCLLAGLVGALAVPILGADGAGGLRLSFVVAAAVPALLLAVRRFSLGAASRSAATESAPPTEARPK